MREKHTVQELTFNWLRRTTEERGLIGWLIMVTIATIAFFSLFRVVYPQAERATPLPHEVVFLDLNDPNARAMLGRTGDQDHLLLPAPPEAAENGLAGEQVPIFHPSFEGHKLELQDLPHKSASTPPARLLNPDEPVLPLLDLRDLKDVKAESPQEARRLELTLKLSGALAERTLAGKPDLAGFELLEPDAGRFRLGVDASGRTFFALPLGVFERPGVVQKLSQKLLGIRFAPQVAKGKADPAQPAVAPAPTWGVAEFQWRPVGAP